MAIDLEEEYDRIYRYCCFHVKDRFLAEDLTQETFLRYFRNDPGIGRRERIAYLYTIARNLCIDYYRMPKTEEFSEETQTEIQGDQGRGSFQREGTIENLEMQMDIEKAVRSLPDEMQEILVLRYVQELGVAETARILEMSRFSLYRREKEALKKLKDQLEGRNGYEGFKRNQSERTEKRAEKNI